MENRNCYDEIVGHKRAGQSLLPDAFAQSHISPDTSKDQNDLGPKCYYRQTISNWDHMWQQMWQMCVQWHRFQHLFEAKTNLTDLYLRVVCVLLPNLSHSCAECFHESLVLEVEQVEFLRHPICPA